MGKNVLGSSNSTTYAGDKNQDPIIHPSGRQYQRHVYEQVALTSDGLGTSTASRYGITDIVPAGNSTNGTLSLAAPVIGCEKTFIYRSTAASSNFVAIDIDPSSAGIRLGGSSDRDYIQFSSLGTAYQAITLIGLSTSLWAVKCIDSTVGGFNAAGGIRRTTTASSN